MPVFTVTAPTGETYRVNAPEGATEAQAIAYAQSQHAPAAPSPVAGAHAAPSSGYDRAKAALDESAMGAVGGNFGDAALLGHGAQLQAGAFGLQTKVANLIHDMRGEAEPYTSADASKAAFDSFRARTASEAEAHPIAAPVASLAGTLAAPGVAKGGAWAAGAKTLPRMMARSGLVNAAIGAAYGHGGADPGQEGRGAASGALFGGLTGAVLPPVVAGLGKALTPFVQAGSRALAPIIDPLAARIARAIASTSGGDATPVERAVAPRPTSDQLRVATALDNIVSRDAASGFALPAGRAPMYSEGPGMAAATEALAHSPGPSAGMVKRGVRANREATFDSVRQDIGRGFGGQGNYLDTVDSYSLDRAAQAKRAMDETGHHLVTLTPDSVVALRSDLASGAIKRAAQNSLASADPEVRNSGADLMRLSTELLDKPSARTLTVRQAQDITYALKKGADAAYAGGNGDIGSALSGLSRSVRTNARTPELGGHKAYDEFLTSYGDMSDREAALQLGRDALVGGGKGLAGLDHTPEAVARQLSDMGAGVHHLYQKGVGEALLNEVMGARGDVGVMRTLLKDRNVAAKVRMAFPDDASFGRFMDAAEQRVAEANLNNRYSGGSGTHARGAAAADLDGGSGVSVGDVIGGVMHPMSIPARVARAAFGQKLPLGRPSIMTNPRLNALAGKALTDPDTMTELLNLLQASRRVSAAPKLAAFAAPAVVGQEAR